jgi:hypothetical protein
MVSVNEQQYFSAHKTILFNAPEYGVNFLQIVKLEEQDMKNKKVPQKTVKK